VRNPEGKILDVDGMILKCTVVSLGDNIGGCLGDGSLCLGYSMGIWVTGECMGGSGGYLSDSGECPGDIGKWERAMITLVTVVSI
jgi:hypothetical protein